MKRDLSKAIELIKSFEGIPDGDPSTVNINPYLCPAGYWTIGWGHVVIGSDGKQIKGALNKQIAYAVYPNGITREEAEILLTDDVRKFSIAVDNLVAIEISDRRFCVLVSFAFNVGIGALKDSTLLKLLNQNQQDQVPVQLLRWTKSNGRELSGLKRRREAEVNLWNSVTA
ncbi:MAG: lysozyme [Gammaproteobacteria bacterium]|nr:MAG: lysozyme [Gammaproteobacteria bacterium]